MSVLNNYANAKEQIEKKIVIDKQFVCYLFIKVCQN